MVISNGTGTILNMFMSWFEGFELSLVVCLFLVVLFKLEV